MTSRNHTDPDTEKCMDDGENGEWNIFVTYLVQQELFLFVFWLEFRTSAVCDARDSYLNVSNIAEYGCILKNPNLKSRFRYLNKYKRLDKRTFTRRAAEAGCPAQWRFKVKKWNFFPNYMLINLFWGHGLEQSYTTRKPYNCHVPDFLLLSHSLSPSSQQIPGDQTVLCSREPDTCRTHF